jgi:hypothetical protein
MNKEKPYYTYADMLEWDEDMGAFIKGKPYEIYAPIGNRRGPGFGPARMCHHPERCFCVLTKALYLR